MSERLVLDDMKRIELEIMDEIDRVCRTNDIPYVLMYGTLLGAHRHGGFIPWDDDIDICMYRKDYERFLEIFSKKRSSERFDAVNYRNGKGVYPFTKIVDTTTIVYENFVRKDIAVGVWVDVFPIDEIDPDNFKLFRRRNRANLWYSFILADPNVGSSPWVKLAKKVVCPLVRGLDPKKYARIIDEVAQETEPGSTGLVSEFVGEGKPAYTFPRNFYEPVELPFEDRTYFGPREYEKILETIYGDWRTPPAEGNRDIHTFEAFQL